MALAYEHKGDMIEGVAVGLSDCLWWACLWDSFWFLGFSLCQTLLLLCVWGGGGGGNYLRGWG